MIVSKKAYYLDLGKTGTSYVEDVIDRACASEFFSPKGERHRGFARRPSDRALRSMLIITSIRNPYSWYASHFTYGRKTNGRVWRTLVQQGFSDPQPDQIEPFLTAILADRLELPKRNHNNPEQAAWRNFPENLGMMTLQYVLLLDPKFLLRRRRSVADIKAWYRDNWFAPERKNLIMFGRKNLTQETVELVRKNAEYFDLKPNYLEILNKIENEQADAELHKVQGIKSYKSYFSDTARCLVEHYERLLFEQFDFTFEEI